MATRMARAAVAPICRALTVAVLSASLVGGCSPTSLPSPSIAAVSNPPQPSPSSTAIPTSSPVPASTAPPTFIPACGRQGDAAGPGVVDQRPEGWYDQGEVPAPSEFPDLRARVYGPNGISIPPFEGPSRIVLYESFSANDAYFESRIKESRRAGGTGTAVTVCREGTEAWLDASTGELIVGWTDRGKSDVLVANVADFTIQQLIESAERVYDCCG